MKTSFLVFYFCEANCNIVETPDLFEERALALWEMGYEGLELMLWDAGLLDRQRLIRFQQDHGLAFSALGTGKVFTRDALSFSDPDPAVRADAITRIKDIIDLSAQVGSPPVIIGSVRGDRSHPEGWDMVRDCLKQCCTHADAKGIPVALEPMRPDESPYVNTVEEGLRMLEEVGAHRLGLLLDNCNMMVTEGDLEGAVARAAGRIVHVQVADHDRRYPSHGGVDLLPFFRALGRAEYAGYVSAELSSFETPLGDAQKALDFLRQACRTEIR